MVPLFNEALTDLYQRIQDSLPTVLTALLLAAVQPALHQPRQPPRTPSGIVVNL